jgi:hypothetical protein
LRFEASLGKQFHETLSKKKPFTKIGLAQGEGPEFKPQYCKKKKKKNSFINDLNVEVKKFKTFTR